MRYEQTSLSILDSRSGVRSSEIRNGALSRGTLRQGGTPNGLHYRAARETIFRTRRTGRKLRASKVRVRLRGVETG